MKTKQDKINNISLDNFKDIEELMDSMRKDISHLWIFCGLLSLGLAFAFIML